MGVREKTFCTIYNSGSNTELLARFSLLCLQNHDLTTIHVTELHTVQCPDGTNADCTVLSTVAPLPLH